MRILITGANGYLGSTLLQALSADPDVSEVFALVRNAQRFADDRMHGFPAGIRWCDWSELDSDIVVLRRVDFICHLAAGRNARAPAEVAETLRLSEKLFRLAAEAGVKGILFASSQAVYGAQPVPWLETTPAAPVSIHGMAKLAAELIGSNLASVQPGTGFTALRLAKLVGPAPVFRVVTDELPHLLAREAMAGRDLMLHAEGQQQLDLLDVRDAADVFLRLIRLPVACWPGTLNVGAGRHVTALDVARMTLARIRHRATGSPTASRILLRKTHGAAPRAFGMGADLLRATLEWVPSYTLAMTIDDVLERLSEV